MPLAIEIKHFKDYPPEARRMAASHIELLRKLPAAFALLLLQQVQAYDWRFPAERRDIDQQFRFLESLSESDRRQLLTGFEQLQLPTRLLDVKWASSPVEFSEQLSNYLWSTHQIDAFHETSSTYQNAVLAAMPNQPPAAPRLGIAVIGKGVEQNSYPLFRNFRPHGTRFTNVNPANGLKTLLAHVADRAAAHPSPFDHWYIDGGPAEPVSKPFLTSISYSELEPNRRALLRKMNGSIQDGIAGPKALLSLLHSLQPEEIGFDAAGQNGAIVSHFATSLLTSGSGTQIFSTSFVQWTTRELWRRAQPLTILARFAPRQRQRPMNEMLSGDEQAVAMDAPGSLIDADMGAYYMWLDQQRLSGAETASFLIWFEDHQEAFVVSPSLPRNTESNSRVDLHWLLA
ncbi:MAG: hypothetical protein J2P41_13575, partial [Blastocatellia bacterium]|nr:hypothetical protein [Blastocatellia bacterium]